MSDGVQNIFKCLNFAIKYFNINLFALPLACSSASWLDTLFVLSLRDGSAGDGFALARGEVLPPDGERGLGGQSGLLRSKSESELEESYQKKKTLKKDFKKQTI